MALSLHQTEQISLVGTGDYSVPLGPSHLEKMNKGREQWPSSGSWDFNSLKLLSQRQAPKLSTVNILWEYRQSLNLTCPLPGPLNYKRRFCGRKENGPECSGIFHFQGYYKTNEKEHAGIMANGAPMYHITLSFPNEQQNVFHSPVWPMLRCAVMNVLNRRQSSSS